MARVSTPVHKPIVVRVSTPVRQLVWHRCPRPCPKETMREFWKEPLSEEQKQALIDALAQQIVKRGLSAPAILFLELNKPLAFIGAQAGIVFSPFLAPFFGFDRVDVYTQLMSERENWDRLVERIEELEEQKRAQPSGE
ncbi:MAG: hypothetical protein NZ874_08705 [Fimbriimonadales bacterium]|nr:hypothetical protein [Fimbriimonadales bacterium]